MVVAILYLARVVSNGYWGIPHYDVTLSEFPVDKISVCTSMTSPTGLTIDFPVSITSRSRDSMTVDDEADKKS